jgi:adenosylcobyric acid synthase
VLGVVPWLDLRLPEEDSLALARKGRASGSGVRIGVVRLPRLSNYSDFDPLEGTPGVGLAYLQRPEEIDGLDLLILPGSKSTIADLEWLRAGGWLAAIRDYYAAGGHIAGICGGYQMLGRRLYDPHGIESGRKEAEGIGLLEIETILLEEKQTQLATAEFLPAAFAAGFVAGAPVQGYEIHHGETTLDETVSPLLRLHHAGVAAWRTDGAISADGRVWGTYLHGFFDSAEVRRQLLASLRPGESVMPAEIDLDRELDRLADHLAAHLDLARLFSHLPPPGTQGR